MRRIKTRLCFSISQSAHLYLVFLFCQAISAAENGDKRANTTHKQNTAKTYKQAQAQKHEETQKHA